ncbi:NADP-dependent oxidoreductase [Leucobacter sp. USHLN153]|uniref:NADP-dependent oxidoreductase n=1 Tax=Leucobacter sp. USHLN153 TaxID=3081268 RepID=UPI003015FAAA
MTVPDSMIVIQQSELGEADVLTPVSRPVPEPRANEVLVRVRAAGVNPTDWKHRRTGGFLADPPFVLGWDVSGEVVALGVGVARFEVGDEVFGMASYPWGHGTHAEYVALPARVLVRKPTEIDHVQAGALPLVSLTAWHALHRYARIEAGQRVLVHAAAGGVGHVAVQIAKAAGAEVIGTASAEKHDFLRSIGVDECIDYRTQEFDDLVSDVDVVLDTIGGETSLRSLRVVREGGVVVSTLPTGDDAFMEGAARLGVRAVRMLVDSSEHEMELIADLVRRGELRAHIDRTFPLRDAADAHRAGETGRTTGKLVLTV